MYRAFIGVEIELVVCVCWVCACVLLKGHFMRCCCHQGSLAHLASPLQFCLIILLPTVNPLCGLKLIYFSFICGIYTQHVIMNAHIRPLYIWSYLKHYMWYRVAVKPLFGLSHFIISSLISVSFTTRGGIVGTVLNLKRGLAAIQRLAHNYVPNLSICFIEMLVLWYTEKSEQPPVTYLIDN